MTAAARGRLATALVVVGVLGTSWRLAARHERLVRPPLEAGEAVVAVEGAARTLRVQPLVCAAPGEGDAGAQGPRQALAGASLVLLAHGAEAQRWALGEVQEVRRGELWCVSLPPTALAGDGAGEGGGAGTYRLRVEGGDPAAMTLEVVESSPLGWLDWVWCGLLLAAMAARLGAWTARPGPATRGQAAPSQGLLWGRPHPALGLLAFVLAQGVLVGAALPLVMQATGLAQGSALGMLAQALMITAAHLGIVYGLAKAEHPQDAARAHAALGACAPAQGWWSGPGRMWAIAGWGAALGVGATVMLALLVSGPSETSAMQEAVRMPGTMLAVAAMATLSPWYEELFFRGYMQGALASRVGVGGAAVASAALFGLVHVPQHLGYLWPVVPICAVGAVAAALRALSGSTAAPFALHLGYNAALVLPAMFAP
jgi:membrane protease YdiL (CAAX protease family)